MSAPYRLRACFRKSEVLHFALLNQILHRSGHIFDRHVGVDAVLVIEINRIDPQALQ